jgi:hypothetical protein
MRRSVMPQIAGALLRDHIRQFSEKCTTRVCARAPAAERIVDKMPFNSVFVGLIHLAL